MNKTIKMMAKGLWLMGLVAGLGLGLGGGSRARAEQVGNTNTYYYLQSDPMTDENMSRIFINEVNDTGSITFLVADCSDKSIYLKTKHPLLVPTEDMDGEQASEVMAEHYQVTARVGKKKPFTIDELNAYRFLPKDVTPKNTTPYNTVALFGDKIKDIIVGLMMEEAVAIRIEPKSELASIKKTLDYKFSGQGFAYAFKMVNYCD